MKSAILAQCFGAISIIMIRESSIMILYATKLGAGEFLSLFSTSIQIFFVAVFIVPFAYIMEHTGKKRVIIFASAMGMGGLLFASLAGFFSHIGNYILVIGLLGFAISRALFVGGWFPLLRGFVPEAERGAFFSRLRVSWQSIVTVFLLISTLVVGKNASITVLQIIIGVAAVLLIGRIYFVLKLPETEMREKGNIPSFWTSVRFAFHNKRLIRFSIYMFFLYLFSYATIPIIFMHANLEIKAPDNFIVLLSVFVNIGSIMGFFLGGKLIKRYNARFVLLSAHLCLAVFNILLLFIRSYTPVSAVLLSVFTFIYAMGIAYSTIGASSEMLGLANQNAINTSIAISLALNNAGRGFARIISGIILELNLIPRKWEIYQTEFSKYHFLYLVFGLILILGFALIVLVPKDVNKSYFYPYGDS